MVIFMKKRLLSGLLILTLVLQLGITNVLAEVNGVSTPLDPAQSESNTGATTDQPQPDTGTDTGTELPQTEEPDTGTDTDTDLPQVEQPDTGTGSGTDLPQPEQPDTGTGTDLDQPALLDPDNVLDEDMLVEPNEMLDAFISELEALSVTADKTDKLAIQTNEISQDKKPIAEGGTVDITKPFSLNLSFRVPVVGDYFAANPGAEGVPENEKANYVNQNDFAVFSLAGLQAVQTTTLELKTARGILVGHVNFAKNATTSKLEAKVTFDGSKDVFGDGETEISDVVCTVKAEFKITDDGTGTPPTADYEITILEKTYQVHVPQPQATYTLTKTGTVSADKTQVHWTVKAKKLVDGKASDLKGSILLDDLTKVGDYVPGTFKVNSALPSSDIVIPADKVLSYTFPEGAMGEQTITFSTEIPSDTFLTSGTKEIINTAKLNTSAGTEATPPATATVKFNVPAMITKEGSPGGQGTGDDYFKDRTLVWTITFNPENRSLTNVVITDDLSYAKTAPDLTLNSVTWSNTEHPTTQTLYDKNTHTSDSNFPGETTDKTGDKTWTHQFKANFAEIKSKTTMIVTYDVANSDPDHPVMTANTYSNTAGITFQINGNGGNGTTKPVNVTIGHSSLKKEAVAFDRSTGIVTWKVTVDSKGQSALAKMQLYDTLSYGGENIETGLAELPKWRGQGRYQRYVKNAELETNVKIELTELAGGQRLTIKNGNGDWLPNSNAPFVFQFQTQVTNPEAFFANESEKTAKSSIKNEIHLYNDTVNLSSTYGEQVYKSNMLEKDTVPRMYIEDLMANLDDMSKVNVGGSAANSDHAFDYSDHSILYRFHINANGIDFSQKEDGNGTKSGAITMTDTLPEGFVWDVLGTGKAVLAYEASKADTGGIVKATKRLAEASMPQVGVSTDGKTLTLTFPADASGGCNLTGARVIMARAVMTNEKAKAFFGSNGTLKVTNNATLGAAAWTPQPSDSEETSIFSKILDKTFEKVTDGEVKWTVDYKPNTVHYDSIVLTDKLPEGLDLRTNSAGQLLIPGNIALQKLDLQPNGSYTAGDAVAETDVASWLSYDLETRTLSFQIPTEGTPQGYRLSYLTDVTADTGNLTNKVTLTAAGITEGTESKQTYAVASGDATATMKISGSVVITKQDDKGKALEGAKFAIKTTGENSKIFRTGTTKADGKLTLRGLPAGAYTLVETEAPAGYDKSDMEYSVKVEKAANASIKTTIEGKSGNAITIKNFEKNTMGTLSVTKTVKDSTPADVFDFTIHLKNDKEEPLSGTFEYRGTGVASGEITIENGTATVQLGDGQGIQILSLPMGTKYTVTEAAAKGYFCAEPEQSGTIKVGETAQAAFLNAKAGKLVISKEVKGGQNPNADSFTFTLDLKDAEGNALSGSYPCTDELGKPMAIRPTISSGGTVTLKHKESITIALPAGTQYTVKETANPSYYGTVTGDTGKIKSEEMQTAKFVNTKVGTLTLSKELAGNNINLADKFNFLVDLKNADGTPLLGSFSYTGQNGARNGTLQSGESIPLGDKQSVTIGGLPDGIRFVVSETDAKGYQSAAKGDKGTIVADQDQKATFVNTKQTSGGSGGGGSGGGLTPPVVPPIVPPIEPPVVPPVVPPIDPPVNPPIDPSEPVVPDRPTNPNRPTPPPGFEEAPHLRPGQVDNPPRADSPDQIVVIDDNDVPLGYYTKTETDPGEFSYIDDEGVPLGAMPSFEEPMTITPVAFEAPRTGDTSTPWLWAALMLFALGGMVVLMIPKARKESESEQKP